MNSLPWLAQARRRIWLEFAAMSSLLVAISPVLAQAPVITNPKDPAYLGANERFDPTMHMWVTVAPMPTARIGFSIATNASNRIFVFGGNDSNNCTPVATVEAYDSSTD